MEETIGKNPRGFAKLKPCPFDLGLRKFALDFVVVIFFKNSKKLQVVV